MIPERKPDPLPSLSHWSPKPIERVNSVEQPESQEGWLYPNKPTGLWVSADGEDDWPAWCEAESFMDLGKAIRYRVILSDPNRLLWLDSATDLLVFTDRYDKPAALPGYTFPKGHYIDWRLVAEDYSGLIISPYQWSCSLQHDTHWYYGWDCASGCIWDAEAVARLERV